MIGITPSPATLSSLEAVYAFVKTKSTPGVEFENQWWYDAELFAAYGCVGSLYDAGAPTWSIAKPTGTSSRRNTSIIPMGDGTTSRMNRTYPKGNEWLATYHAFKCICSSATGCKAVRTDGLRPLLPALSGKSRYSRVLPDCMQPGRALLFFRGNTAHSWEGSGALRPYRAPGVALRGPGGHGPGRATGVYLYRRDNRTSGFLPGCYILASEKKKELPRLRSH